MNDDEPAIEAARRFAEAALFPAADDVEVAGRIPQWMFRGLDAAGLTGMSATGLPGAARLAVTQALSSGCASLAFVWIQHQGALIGALSESSSARGRTRVERLREGIDRGALATTGLHPPDPLTVSTNPGGGWLLHGRAPWVTGFAYSSLMRVAAHDDDAVREFLIPLLESPTMVARPLDLSAMNATSTVEVAFHDHPVAADDALARTDWDAWTARSEQRVAANGAIALGIAERAGRLAEDADVLEEVSSAAAALASATAEDLPPIRARCALLAARAADVYSLTVGSGALLAHSTADRLSREARFTSLAGTTHETRELMQADITRQPQHGTAD